MFFYICVMKIHSQLSFRILNGALHDYRRGFGAEGVGEPISKTCKGLQSTVLLYSVVADKRNNFYFRIISLHDLKKVTDAAGLLKLHRDYLPSSGVYPVS